MDLYFLHDLFSFGPYGEKITTLQQKFIFSEKGPVIILKIDSAFISIVLLFNGSINVVLARFQPGAK